MPVAVLRIERPECRAEDGLVPKRVVAPDPLVYQNTGGDEEEYIDFEDPSLIFTDQEKLDLNLVKLNTLRRERESCDVVLFVAEREILAHRSVLAAFSPTLSDLIHVAQSEQDRARDGYEEEVVKGGVEMEVPKPRRPLYLEFPSVDFEAFDALISYAYTSKLEICAKKVADVYKTASFLRVESAAKVAAKYLAENLSPVNAIGVRKCANKASDSLLAASVDAYIRANIADIIANSPEFTALPCVQVEVIGDWGDEEESAEELATRVLAWFQSQPVPEHRDFRIESLTQNSHLLYLDSSSVLRDCADIEDSVSVSSCDLVLDYRAKKKYEGRDGQLPPAAPIASLLINPAGPMPHQQRPSISNSINHRPPSPMDQTNAHNTQNNNAGPPPPTLRSCAAPHMSSSESLNSLASAGSLSVDADEVRWELVAVERTTDAFVIALAVMHQRLVALSVQIINSAKRELRNGRRSEAASPLGSPTRSADSPEAARANSPVAFPLPALNRQRCSHGLVYLNNRLFVYGGYDRGECLNSLEELMVEEESGNWVRWRNLPPMKEERGRFDAVAANGRLFAIGGSNGTRDLDTVEFFDTTTEVWADGPRMLFPKSNHGCSVLDGNIFCIGGWNGQRGITEVEILDAEKGVWTTGPPLNTGRYQSGCCTWRSGSALIAAGGCEAWGCLGSVEMLEKGGSAWTPLPELAIARRGCGAAVIGDKLYVIGGTDGQKSLTSVEVLDLSAPGKGWASGPSLGTPRANVRAVFRDGVLVVVGGFSGKAFLPTMEYLDLEAGEWKSVHWKALLSSK